MTVSRRVFLETLAATAGPLMFGAHSPFRERAPMVLRIGLVATAHPDVGSASRGAALGVAEARRVASFLGAEISLTESIDPARLIRESGAHLLIGGTDEASGFALAEVAERHARLFFNIGAGADALRGARCLRTTFHIAASDAMRRDARAAVASGAGQGSIELWHPGLVRYGAAQLNDRFRAEHARPMDSAAWSAWMAVKIAWEATARLRGFETSRVSAWLEDTRTRFDGHKGRALSFRPWNHQLRQPLYHVAANGDAAPITEIPPLTRGDATSVATQLDRLGETPGESSCQWEAP